MRKLTSLILGMTILAAALGGCSQSPHSTSTVQGEHKDGDGHEHKDGDGHKHKDGDGHEHKDGDGHEHKDGDGHEHKDGDGHKHKDSDGPEHDAQHQEHRTGADKNEKSN